MAHPSPSRDHPLPLVLSLAGLGGLFFLWWKGRAIMDKVTGFDPANVLPDSALYGFQPTLDIQKFLVERNSFLASYKWPSDIGETLLSLWIARWAAQFNINPAWILVRLQAEQGLIETDPAEASAWAVKPKTWREIDSAGQPTLITGTMLEYRLRWALGFNATEEGFKPFLAGHLIAGIGNQVRGMSEWTQRSGISEGAAKLAPMTIDGEVIKPATRATRALYVYTPHVSAARSTQAVYQKYFPQFTYAA